MSHVAWIKAHAAEAPPALVARVTRLIESDAALEAMPTAEALVAAAEHLLGEVVKAGATSGREIALDLLAADSCVTWAFEAASELPSELAARAEAAMRQLAQVAA